MDTPPPQPPPLGEGGGGDLNSLRAIKVLGKGAMGTVFLVHDPEDTAAATFALKVVDKSTFQSKFEAERRARWETTVLSRLSAEPDRHPFLPSLISRFEDRDFLAWAVPFCPGGDLNALRHRQTDRVFSPAVARFYLAEILVALCHLHSRLGLAFRDLKPENVLVQASGHVTLSDFDLSRSLSLPTVHSLLARRNDAASVDSSSSSTKKKARSARVSPVGRASRRPEDENDDDGSRSHSFVGTEEYVAPEVVRGDWHEFSVDWWALGVLAYEMVYGATPFKGRTRKETFRNVLHKEPEFVGKRRSELTDLIQRLLHKDPTRRLGYLRGAHEIMDHPFFDGVRWDMLTDVLRPPFIPPTEDDDDGELSAGKKGFGIREYFEGLRAPPEMSSFSFPPSPDHERDEEVSFADF